MRPTFRNRWSEPRTRMPGLSVWIHISATVADAASWRCKAQDELACGSGLFRAGDTCRPVGVESTPTESHHARSSGHHPPLLVLGRPRR
jgi:hypothetical protein